VKILLIEDDPVVSRTTVRMLRARNYEVATAPDAIAAISTARAECPDVVVLDLGLPGGGGLAVLDRLRGLPVTAATPVLVVTGGATPEQLKRLEEGGASTVLTKPVDADDLVAAIEKVFAAEV
jgi:two-component system KDP operon response regulator KdpE